MTRASAFCWRSLRTSTSRTARFPAPGQHGVITGMELQGVGSVCIKG